MGRPTPAPASSERSVTGDEPADLTVDVADDAQHTMSGGFGGAAVGVARRASERPNETDGQQIREVSRRAGQRDAAVGEVDGSGDDEGARENCDDGQHGPSASRAHDNDQQRNGVRDRERATVPRVVGRGAAVVGRSPHRDREHDYLHRDHSDPQCGPGVRSRRDR